MQWKLRTAVAVGVVAFAVAVALMAISVSAASTRSAKAGADIQQLTIATTNVKLLDRGKDWSYPDNTIQALGLECLYEVSPSGKLVPALATSVARPNTTTYVYTLRPGVTFWDGHPMTSDDVAGSLNRYMQAGSQLAQFYSDVKSVAASGSTKVTVVLKKPDSTWPNKSAIATPVVENAFAQAHPDDIGSPNVLNMGTGPFEFKSFAPNQSITLTANPHWWGGHVGVQKLVIDILSDPTAIALALRSGSVDGFLSAVGDYGPYANIPGTTLRVAPGNAPFYLSMNTRTGPWSDVHVRRAVAYLVNRQAIIKAAKGGYAVPLDTFVSPTLLSSIASPGQVKAFYNSYAKYPFSITAARKEIAMSKYAHGFSATWPVYGGASDSQSSQAVAQIMAQNMARIGIKIHLTTLPVTQWLSQVYYGPRNKIGIINLGYSAATDPIYFYDLFLNSADAKPQGSNSADFVNRQADALLQQATQASSNKVELAALQKLSQIAAAQVPYIFFGAQQDGLVLSNKYKMPQFSDAWQVRPWALSIMPAS